MVQEECKKTESEDRERAENEGDQRSWLEEQKRKRNKYRMMDKDQCGGCIEVIGRFWSKDGL